MCDWDGVRCDEMFMNDTVIRCITNPQGYGSGDVRVKIPAVGHAITDLQFLYGDKWSSIRTWGSGWPKKDDWLHIPAGDVVIIDMTPPVIF